eukprot:gnl/TRDRNA2_/TRDRNA2_65619_c0_seq1.p1 gnl/TRDRNA2_/TRDRNA2_65619_c0~~gnl/TRDRNA2_/TRDRNA2_65619_c0_seq1.p1  ORF type:complete len:227 (-),score=24.99 gnl/TRDRNA2_/TRDRNA2_65619_c0_seq1:112-792(-)
MRPDSQMSSLPAAWQLSFDVCHAALALTVAFVVLVIASLAIMQIETLWMDDPLDQTSPNVLNNKDSAIVHEYCGKYCRRRTQCDRAVLDAPAGTVDISASISVTIRMASGKMIATVTLHPKVRILDLRKAVVASGSVSGIVSGCARAKKAACCCPYAAPFELVFLERVLEVNEVAEEAGLVDGAEVTLVYRSPPFTCTTCRREVDLWVFWCDDGTGRGECSKCWSL